MDYDKLLDLKKTITNLENEINKAEGQYTLLKEQLKEQGFTSLKVAQKGIEELKEKKEEYHNQYKNLYSEIETLLQTIESEN